MADSKNSPVVQQDLEAKLDKLAVVVAQLKKLDSPDVTGHRGSVRQDAEKLAQQGKEVRLRLQTSSDMRFFFQLAREISPQLAKLKQQTVVRAREAGHELRHNLYLKVSENYAASMKALDSATNAIQKRLSTAERKRLADMSSAIGQPLSADDVELIVSRGQSENVLQEMQMLDQHSLVRLRDMVESLEDRHTEILRLEQQVLAVKQCLAAAHAFCLDCRCSSWRS